MVASASFVVAGGPQDVARRATLVFAAHNTGPPKRRPERALLARCTAPHEDAAAAATPDVPSSVLPKKPFTDELFAKVISRKLLVFLVATVFLLTGQLESTDWVQ